MRQSPPHPVTHSPTPWLLHSFTTSLAHPLARSFHRRRLDLVMYGALPLGWVLCCAAILFRRCHTLVRVAHDCAGRSFLTCRRASQTSRPPETEHRRLATARGASEQGWTTVQCVRVRARRASSAPSAPMPVVPHSCGAHEPGEYAAFGRDCSLVERNPSNKLGYTHHGRLAGSCRSSGWRTSAPDVDPADRRLDILADKRGDSARRSIATVSCFG